MGSVESLALPLPVARVPALPGASGVSRVWTFAMDALSLVALVFMIPFAIIAAGLPIVLAVRLLLWLSTLL